MRHSFSVSAAFFGAERYRHPGPRWFVGMLLGRLAFYIEVLSMAVLPVPKGSRVEVYYKTPEDPNGPLA